MDNFLLKLPNLNIQCEDSPIASYLQKILLSTAFLFAEIRKRSLTWRWDFSRLDFLLRAFSPFQEMIETVSTSLIYGSA